ncbi:MAG: hypothetical protein K0Q74_818, partial [Gammaproteobacteria bacterium]|nr:hypothetical protein [Gammaproteobacteria bacterium]
MFTSCRIKHAASTNQINVMRYHSLKVAFYTTTNIQEETMQQPTKFEIAQAKQKAALE